MLQAVLRPGHDAGLLTLLTVDPDAVLGQVTDAVMALLGDQASVAMVDTVVRLMISHLVQSTVPVEDAVMRISRVAAAFG